MRVTVRFKGFVGKLCPDDYIVDARTPFEAIRAVSLQLKDKLKRPNGHKFSFFAKGYKTKDALYSSLKDDVLELYPMFLASGGGKYTNSIIMIAVAVVIIACVMLSAGTFSPWAATALTGAEKFSLIVGTSLLISGVTSAVSIALTKEPDKPDANTSDQRYHFSLNGNTTVSGTAIPLCYGKYKMFGQLLSYASQSAIENQDWSLMPKNEKIGETKMLVSVGTKNLKGDFITILPSFEVESVCCYDDVLVNKYVFSSVSGNIGEEGSFVYSRFDGTGTQNQRFDFKEEWFFLGKKFYKYDNQSGSVLLSPKQQLNDFILGLFYNISPIGYAPVEEIPQTKITSIEKTNAYSYDIGLSNGNVICFFHSSSWVYSYKDLNFGEEQ